MNNKHFVIIRLGVLGDVALTTGVLSYLHKHYGFTFSIITRAMFASLFEHNPAITQVHTLPNTIPLFTLIKQARALAQQYVDTPLIDLHGNLRSFIISYFWNNRVSVYPKYSKERRRFLQNKTEELSSLLSKTTVTQRYFSVFLPYIQNTLSDPDSPSILEKSSSITLNTALPSPEELCPNIILTEEESAFALTKFSPPKPCIAIHPYATHSTKMWSYEYWETLVSILSQRGYHVIILGKADLVFSSPSVSLEYNFTNRTSIRESLVLLRHSTILITGDSGLLHLASGVNTPSVALFGATTKEWGFFPPKPSVVLEDITLACRPCSLHGKATCPYDMECMSNIEPQYVAEQAISLFHTTIHT